MKLRNLFPLFLAASALVSTSCLPMLHDKAIRFRYWGDTEEVKIVESLLREFEKLHPGVKVRGERKSADIYADILLQECVSKTAPDVIFVSTDTFDTVAASGIMADLSPYLAKESDLKASDYYPMLIRRFSVGSSLMALPNGIAPISLIYYNKSLMDAAKLPYPKDNWNWQDLRRYAMAMTKRGVPGKADQLGFGDDWNMDESWALAAGGGIVDDYFKPSRLTCASPASMAGILFRWKLLQEDKVMPSSADTQSINSGVVGMFMNGDLAMFQSGVWHVPAFRQIKKFKWDVAPFPLKKDGRYISGGAGYAMNKNTANPDMTWQLIKFIAGNEGQARMAENGLVQPALKKLALSKVFLDGQDPQNKKILISAAEHAVPNSVWPAWKEFHSSLWTPLTDPIWLPGYKGGEAGVIAVLKDVESKTNQKYFHR